MQKQFLFLLIPIAFFITSCGIYSHSGASIPPDSKTFSVSYISNVANIVNPLLSQNLTEKLKQKFVNETQLKLTSTEGDLAFSGKITSYEINPTAVQGNQQNAINRLTITIEITLENKKAAEKNFTQTFSNFIDFSASDDFATREQELSDKVSVMLVQDVFNKAFINW